MIETCLKKHTKKSFIVRFLFPALGALLFGYEIGATSCATISIKVICL